MSRLVSIVADIAEPFEATDRTEASRGRERTRDHRRADHAPGNAGSKGSGTRTYDLAGLFRPATGSGSATGSSGYDPPRQPAASRQTARYECSQL